jgi:hypothetical protein
VLAAVGQVAWHLRLGRFGIGYGVLVVIVGLVTGISRSADRVLAGRSANGLLLDVVLPWRCFRSSSARPSRSVGRLGYTGV